MHCTKFNKMNIDFFRILLYFVLYSFLGWVLESVVRTISERKLINTGFLHGPFCPIYGIGAIILILLLNYFKGKIILTFLVSIVILTLWEYLVGVFLEKTFHTKYWDYSNHKFNIQGRICLTNSICWGVLGVVFIQYIHPFFERAVNTVDINILKWIVYTISVVLVIDAIISIVKVKNIQSTLDKIEEINNEIKEKLKEIKKYGKDIEKAKKVEINTIVEDLKKKRNRIIIRLYRNIYRLKKAFPAINSKEITEVLNKKIEIVKSKKRKK